MVTHARFPRLAVFAALALSACSEPTTPVPGSPSDAAARALDASAFAEREFVPRSDNPYFPLVPGTSFHYRSQTPDGIETEDFIVTTGTKRILGVTTRVVEDVVRLDGSITEHTFDWFAQDEETGDVWYTLGKTPASFSTGSSSAPRAAGRRAARGRRRGSSWRVTPRWATPIVRSLPVG